MLDVGGRTLLARSLDALSGADPVVVVGPRRPDVHGVRWTREEPPGGGPVAALAAGLALVDRPRVVVLAGDLRGVTPDVVGRLLDALDRQAREHPAAGPDPDGAVLVDAAGRRQWLLGAWRTAALRAAIPAAPAGHALRRVLNGLTIADVPARGDEAADVDTAGDLP
ncbi:molybdenum cofactor guanylyltransferase [Prauserella halophila]